MKLAFPNRPPRNPVRPICGTILACDTTQKTCSVALSCEKKGGRVYEKAVWRDDGDGYVVCEVVKHIERGFEAVLTPMIADLMQTAQFDFDDIDALAVSLGPGTFTGVRIGLAAMQGFGLALGKPLIGVSTLAAIAAPALGVVGKNGSILVAVDARHDEFYTQIFALDDAQRMVEKSPAAVKIDMALLEDLQTHMQDTPVYIIGTGRKAIMDAAQNFKKKGAQINVKNLAAADLAVCPDWPQARFVAHCARFGVVSRDKTKIGTEQKLAPIYLRAPDAVLPDPNKSAIFTRKLQK